MSEYQYYEFQAIDKPLDKDQMAELRALSTRATITSTRFVNVYNWGSFHGDPLALMEHYFDAFVYVTNWGTRQLMLRLPRQLLDPEAVSRYCVTEETDTGAEDGLLLQVRGNPVILDFNSQEEGADWEEGDEWLTQLISLRDELANGDLRALHLGWLRAAPMQALYAEDADAEDDLGARRRSGARWSRCSKPRAGKTMSRPLNGWWTCATSPTEMATIAVFQARLSELRAQNAKRSALMRRLDHAGLRP